MKKNKTELLNYIYILIGSLIMAIGITGFLSPNKVATGGTAGLAIILYYILPVPLGVLMGIINIPLLLLGFKYLGKAFLIKSIVCIGAMVVFIELLFRSFQLPNLTSNIMLATLYGGVAIGIGLGLIFKGGASAGGGTILAKIISIHSSIKTSTVLLLLDAIIIMLVGILFKSLELALWSMISIYVATKLIDAVLIGAPSEKIVHISSFKNLDELSRLIADKMKLTGTIIKGKDLGQAESKDIIFMMVEKNKLNALKQLALQFDPNVKMIVMQATEVLGKGTGSI